MFKVVPDQFKIAQGWVRCGHCADVFDARLHLQPETAAEALPISGDDRLPADGKLARATASPEPGLKDTAVVAGEALAAGTPRAVPRWIAEATQSPSVLAQTDGGQWTGIAHQKPGPTWAHQEIDAFDPGAWKAARQQRGLDLHGATPSSSAPAVADFAKTTPTGLQRPAADDSPSSMFPASSPVPLSTHQASEDSHPETGANWLVQVARRDESEDESYVCYDFGDSEHLAGQQGKAADAVTAKPLATSGGELSFVREARRGDFWRQRRIRAGLAALALVLSVTLALQGLVKYRDELAAEYPRAAPTLEVFCAAASCIIGAARRINALVIDSSTFNKLAGDAYRLGFVVKNTASIALRIPSIEITLTDSQEQPVIRRVVNPAQFGISAATVAPYGEVSGVLSLRVALDLSKAGPGSLSESGAQAAVSTLPITGYRMLAFYP